jgi:isocitrate/isopropylmalate dehydrogenase
LADEPPTGSAHVHRVAVIRGDGIGPALIDAALEVNAAAERRYGYRLELDEIVLCDDESRLGPPELERILEADSVLKGPVGGPERRAADGTEAGLIGGVLRPALDTYANVRPVRSWPGAPRLSPGSDPIDYVVVRENVEGLYASRAGGARSPHGAADVLLTTLEGTRRVARHAFSLARSRSAPGREPSVTCVDKANVLQSHAFFRRIVAEVATEFTDVTYRTLHADAAGQALLLEPWSFDVLVMENFLGDVLSEVGGATVGGVGMLPSGNIGAEHAYFEPAHGSAPDLAGRDVANPIGQILATAMLLDHLGEPDAGHAIEDAVREAFATRALVLDDAGRPTIGSAAAARTVASLVRQSASRGSA